jgi:hypothetical protein
MVAGSFENDVSLVTVEIGSVLLPIVVRPYLPTSPEDKRTVRKERVVLERTRLRYVNSELANCVRAGPYDVPSLDPARRSMHANRD